MFEERFNGIEQRLDRLDGRIDKLDGRVDTLDGRVDELGRQMRGLHEDVIETIKAIPDPTPRLEQVLKRETGQLREEIGRRLDPLEAAVRRHFGG